MLHRRKTWHVFLVATGAATLALFTGCSDPSRSDHHHDDTTDTAANDDSDLTPDQEEAALGLINGTPTGASSFGDVGAVGLKLSATESALCTATVISPHVVLTAGHCVSDEAGNLLPATSLGFTLDPALSSQTGQFIAAARVARHPNFIYNLGGSGLDGNDVALIGLAAGVTVTPRHLATAMPAPEAALTAVGYGLDENHAYGTRKSGAVVLAGFVDATAFNLSIDSLFAIGNGPSGTNTCNGDSGGPFFDASGSVLAIVEGGNENCTGDSVATSMLPLVAWVSQEAATLESQLTVVGPQPQPSAQPVQPTAQPVQPTTKPTVQPHPTPQPKPKKIVKLPKKKVVKKRPPQKPLKKVKRKP